VMHRGHGRIARRLVGLVFDGPAGPARGDAILANEKEVGEITSVAESPLMGSPIALGYVHRDYAAPGTALTVRTAASTPSSAAPTSRPATPSSVAPTFPPSQGFPSTRPADSLRAGGEVSQKFAQRTTADRSAIPARVHQIPFSR
jgi:hypothetical protein